MVGGTWRDGRVVLFLFGVLAQPKETVFNHESGSLAEVEQRETLQEKVKSVLLIISR